LAERLQNLRSFKLLYVICLEPDLGSSREHVETKN
jgi:hypothetical protein